MIKRKYVVLSSLIGASIILLTAIVYLTGTVLRPFGSSDRDITVIIKKGDSLNRITRIFYKNKVIQSTFAFKWYSVISGNNNRYKSGAYRIQGKVSMLQLSSLLIKGADQLTKITIPEGWRMKEIFNHLDKRGIGDKQIYRQLSNNNDFIQLFDLPDETTTLEGFLFPDTYYFSKETTEKTVLTTMVRNFLKRLPKDYGKMASKVGLNFYQSVILAAIIEKETGTANERKLISSVFHNRLRKRMRLQSDPTVIYGIKNFDGNITRKLLRKRTPYNTYVIYGLPPTPIANPGLAALKAAVQPEKTEYLYFVAMGNGQHKFSFTYRDHDRAVTKFQRRRRKNYRSF